MKDLVLVTRKFYKSIAILLFIGFPMVVFAHDSGDHYGAHMMWQGYGMILGPFMMIVFIALIILAGVLIVRWLSGHGISFHAQSKQESINILKNRFARGEIDKDEFEERKKLLQNDQ